jgi:hypothetical protein
LVWPHDAARRLVAESGTDDWFWIHVGASNCVYGAGSWDVSAVGESEQSRRTVESYHLRAR